MSRCRGPPSAFSDTAEPEAGAAACVCICGLRERRVELARLIGKGIGQISGTAHAEREPALLWIFGL